MRQSPSAPARAAARRRPRLLVLGDLALDVVVRREAGVAVGSDVDGTVAFRAGGSAANTARAFAALGGEATFVGAVGDDGIARRLVSALRAEKVRVHVRRASRPSARLAVLLDERGERSFVTQRGAADMLRAADIRPNLVSRADALHLPAYSLISDPLRAAALAALALGRRAGLLVSVDLASQRPLMAHGRAAARRVIAEAAADVLFANVAEARALAAGDTTRLLGLAPVVVIKEGASGCQVLWLADGPDARAERNTSAPGAASREQVGEVLQLAVATKPLKVSDTTGAGDAFDAGFLYALLEQVRAERPQSQPRSVAVTADRSHALRQARVLRRAAVAGHRSAAALLTRPRQELSL